MLLTNVHPKLRLLISSLFSQALCSPDLPVSHILLTSHSEPHIHNAFEKKEVRSLVYEIPEKISGEGIATIISLDGADMDNDIYIFLEHLFKELREVVPIFRNHKSMNLRDWPTEREDVSSWHLR
jgi:hypothetical protein